MSEKNGELTATEVKILAALAKAKKPLPRKAMETLGGTSRILGAGSREGLGKQGGGLEGKGYLTCQKLEGERQLHYSITPNGRKALEKAKTTK